MRLRVLICLIFLGVMSAFAKDDAFVLRGYINRADTTEWVAVDSVGVSISAVNDTAAVKYRMLVGNNETHTTGTDAELRIMVYGKPGKYLLTLDREGYEPLLKEVERKFKDQNAVWVGTMSMQPERHKTLNEVEVVATAIKMVMHGDTIVYNASAFNLAEGSMLDALIRQLPNTELDANGQIKVNGRVINSLLINGKDFFTGDMEVAMKNLPAYTVKNIEVYDKAAEDDYLTQASQKLARKENEENLVMDVVLKKEYSVGYMGSVQATYGTDNRWKGKAFGLGFTDNWRLSAFVNANNMRDTSEAGTSGQWSNGWGASGEATIAMGGIDYLYDDSEKLKINGNVIYSHEKYDNRTETASTQFYESGDLYRRSASKEIDTRRHLRSFHHLDYKGEDFYLSVAPKIDWLAKDVTNLNREATFNSQPQPETSRIEALDSVFARPFSKRYNDIMLTRLRTASISNPGWIGLYLNTSATVRTPNVPGRVGINLNGSYFNDYSDYHTLYTQRFGGANLNPAAPVNSDRYSTEGVKKGKLDATVSYTQRWNDVNDRRSLSYNLRANIGYHMTHVSKDYTLFTADSEGDEAALPSLTMPEHAIADALNSYNSANSDHNLVSSLNFDFRRQVTAPTDSGLNPEFAVFAGIEHKFRHNSLDYNTLLPSHELIVRRNSYFTPNASFVYNSGNKKRYVYAGLNYNLTWGEPAINLFLKNRQSSNPLIVYENNAENLRASHTHHINLNFNSIGRIRLQNISGGLGWSTTVDAIGNAAVYNPETGVTTYRPQNINGNWQSNAYLYYSYTVGSRKHIDLSVNGSGSYSHSVDFHSTTGAPTRSLVKNLNTGGGVRAAYKFKNGSNIAIGGSTFWNHATSRRENFNDVSAMSYQAFIIAVVQLPWQIEIRTNLNMHCSSGYDIKEMNEAQWLWNATVSKSLLKGNLVIEANANDILGQVKPYKMTVNSQGRYETWTNTMRRYVALSLIWRFNHTPKGKERTNQTLKTL